MHATFYYHIPVKNTHLIHCRMSRCPDAQRCEARIDEVLKRVENITWVWLDGDPSRAPLSISSITIHQSFSTARLPPYKFQVRPNYIATGTEGYHVYCKHGEVECAGNIQQVSLRVW